MKKITPLLVLLILLSGIVSSQKREVLITIDGTEITKAEFERIYRKNNQNLLEDSDIKSPKEYLELYIDFKLKVVDAMNLRMDTGRAFREELAGYRKELAAPYLTDMNYDEALVRELYRRMTQEINASHILFLVDENATQEQEEAVLQKTQQVRNEILAGKDFHEAALEYSEDPSAQSNRGNLGYFTAFQMVAPFENAAFSIPAGTLSEPVRTSFGYHLIQVNGIRENLGEIKVSHIMKMFPQGEENFDKRVLKTEIDALYNQLKEGADFAELAKQHSDDKRSAVQGGEMPWFSSGRMIAEFSEPAFALKNTGDITEPVETAFGYHIIKKTGHRPVPPFEEVRHEIEEQIKRDPERNNSSRKAFIAKLKEEYNFEINEENLRKISALPVNETPDEHLVLFTIDHQKFNTDDFQRFIQKENLSAGTYSDYVEDWTDDEIIALEDARLEDKHADFRFLMQEYHDGLLLFNIMEEKIWNFAAEDSTGLENFYRKNQGMFQWEERFRGLVITCMDEKTREEADTYFDAGLTSGEIEDLLNTEGQKIEIKQGAWEKGNNQVVDYYVWNGTAPTGFNPRLTFIRGDVIPPEPKTLDEARGMYISEYQNFLEKEWLKELRKKYKVKVNKKLLKSIPHV
jgi:peptidyl-prolyl cis-trans isomerase SurA